MDLRPAWDRMGRRSGSFRESGLLLGVLGRDLEHCFWLDRDDLHAARRALRGRDSAVGNAAAR